MAETIYFFAEAKSPDSLERAFDHADEMIAREHDESQGLEHELVNQGFFLGGVNNDQEVLDHAGAVRTLRKPTDSYDEKRMEEGSEETMRKLTQRWDLEGTSVAMAYVAPHVHDISGLGGAAQTMLWSTRMGSNIAVVYASQAGVVSERFSGSLDRVAFDDRHRIAVSLSANLTVASRSDYRQGEFGGARIYTLELDPTRRHVISPGAVDPKNEDAPISYGFLRKDDKVLTLGIVHIDRAA